MINELLLFALGGMFGGLTRVAIAIAKSKNKKLKIKPLVINAISSMVIGTFVGLLIDKSFIVSLIGGYAGIDVIEGLLKSKGIELKF